MRRNPKWSTIGPEREGSRAGGRGMQDNELIAAVLAGFRFPFA